MNELDLISLFPLIQIFSLWIENEIITENTLGTTNLEQLINICDTFVPIGQNKYKRIDIFI